MVEVCFALLSFVFWVILYHTSLALGKDLLSFEDVFRIFFHYVLLLKQIQVCKGQEPFCFLCHQFHPSP